MGRSSRQEACLKYSKVRKKEVIFMKINIIKKFLGAAPALTFVFGASGCSDNANGNSGADGNKKEIVCGKSQGPYTELFEAAVVPILEKQGYTLRGVDFSDLLTADIALNDGDVDVNVERHTAYAENFNANNNGDLTPISPIPTVSACLFSVNHTSLDEIADGAKVAVPNDAANTAVTQDDIVENPHNIVFTEMKSPTIPVAIQDFDYAAITGSIVYNAGIDASTALANEDIQDHGLLKNGAARGRELAQNYKPKFSSSAEYTKFMEKFGSTSVFGEEDFDGHIVIETYKFVFQ